MNERIRQLADQAHEYASGVYDQRIATEGPENVFFYQISNEKFAQLIVAECLEACSRANEIRHFVPPGQQQVVLDCMREIESNFGVEE
jgi:hypothetical protein